MALQNLGKETVLEALDTATLSMGIIGSTGSIIDGKRIALGEFAFTTSASGMVLSADVVFDIPAGSTVLYVRLYAADVPANNIAFLDQGVLPGTTAERTFTYAGTYALTGYTITVA